MDFGYSIFLLFCEEEQDAYYKFLQLDQSDRKQPSATFHNSTAQHVIKGCQLKRKGMNSKSFSNGGLPSNTKSHGKFGVKLDNFYQEKTLSNTVLIIA